jgi:hypothetical protein
VQNYCTLLAGTGFTQQSVAIGSTSVNCNVAGYSGTTTYSCSTNLSQINGSACAANACTVASITGFDSTSLAHGASAVSANCKSGYSGKVSYGPCSTPGGSLTPTGTCTLITACNIPAGNGHAALSIAGTAARTGADAQNLNGTRSATVTCQNTGGYSGVSASFSCNDSGSLTAGNCTCATGYSRAGTTANTACTANSCSVPAGTGYDSLGNVTGTGNINCKAGYRNGSPVRSYSCNVNGTTTYYGSCEINYCKLSAGTGYDAINQVSGTGAITCKSGYRNGSTPPRVSALLPPPPAAKMCSCTSRQLSVLASAS